MNVSRTIAEYVSRVQYEDLPASAVDAAKKSNILDTLAVAWACTAAPGSAELRELATRVADDDGATLWSGSRRVPAATAAFTNGAFRGGPRLRRLASGWRDRAPRGRHAAGRARRM